MSSPAFTDTDILDEEWRPRQRRETDSVAAEHDIYRRHRGPARRFPLHAQEPDVDALQNLVDRRMVTQGGVDQLDDISPVPVLPYKIHEIDVLLDVM